MYEMGDRITPEVRAGARETRLDSGSEGNRRRQFRNMPEQGREAHEPRRRAETKTTGTWSRGRDRAAADVKGDYTVVGRDSYTHTAQIVGERRSQRFSPLIVDCHFLQSVTEPLFRPHGFKDDLLHVYHTLNMTQLNSTLP